MTELFRAVAVQMDVEAVTDPARKDEGIALNRDRAIRAIEAAIETDGPPVRLAVLPAGFLQAPLPDRTPEIFEQVCLTLPGPEIEPLILFCQRHNLFLAGSCVERFPPLPGWYFHSGFLLGPEGLLIRYPKTQARSVPHVVVIKDRLEEYRAVVGPDLIHPVAETAIGRIAVPVESEIYVPEVGRAFAAKGVEILAHPTLHRPRTPGRPLAAARRARAFENRCFIVTANHARTMGTHPKTGERWETQAAGESAIVGPDGNDLAAIGHSGEGTVIAEIDLTLVRGLTNSESEFTPALYRSLYE